MHRQEPTMLLTEVEACSQVCVPPCPVVGNLDLAPTCCKQEGRLQAGPRAAGSLPGGVFAVPNYPAVV